MSKKLLLASLISMALAGCNQESIDIGSSRPDVDTGPGTGGGGTPGVKYIGILSLDGINVFGKSVKCNDQPASGFEFVASDSISCYVDDLLIATYPSGSINLVTKALDTRYLQLTLADEYKDNSNKKTNIITLIQNMAVTRHSQIDFDFTLLERARFERLLNDINMESEAFEQEVINETAGSLADKVPSTHIPNIEPEITVSDKPGFVSVNAEKSLQYTPTETILTKAVLQDASGKPVEGIAYFSASARGKTNENGEFEFVWGEAVSFGIDTFELGSVRGNKTVFKVTDLGEEQRGRNAEALIERYRNPLSSHLKLSEKTEAVFAQYPNVINEIISLSLNDKDAELNLGGATGDQPATGIKPAEFKTQFTLGQAFEIDKAICGQSCDADAFGYIHNTRNVAAEMGSIQADINKLWGVTQGWEPVERFHVFHDSTNFYGSTGHARGQAAVNIANTAFPVMMARNDNNYWLKFGDKKAWDEKGLAYITEAPSTVTPDNVGASTATFNLPFVSIGELGKGKVMVMGNARYNSVLVCPNGYSWNGSVNAEGQCSVTTDSDDMTHFFQNTLRYLTNKTVAEKIAVGTNIPHVYFKRHGQVIGSSAPYQLAPVFNATTEQLSSFDNIDPESMPLLLINAYEYVGNDVDNAYQLPMSADLNKPKLNVDDITALIEYVTKGGSVLVMETINENNNIGHIARLFDSAGLAFGMNNSVVSNGNGPSGGYPDRVRSHQEYGSWVIERYAAVSEGAGAPPKLPYTIKEDGTVVWDFILNNKPDDKPKLEVVSWNEMNDKGEIEKQLAFINEADHFEKNDKNEWIIGSDGLPIINQASLNAAKNRILEQFKVNGKFSYQECTNSTYHYEINCLEYRPGNGIPLTGGMYIPAYTELNLGEAEAQAMVKAANLGVNIESLYQHERYFRTEGAEGVRLSSVDVNRIYQNMTVWLWNNLAYRYESAADDELGFERFTQFLNCYTSDKALGNTTCPDDVKATLSRLNMVYGSDKGVYSGKMNPSYPLNYMEKPLTRLMLGRSFWDYDVKVDIRQFPGEPSGSQGGDTLTLDMRNYSAAWYAGNRQPTGQWAVAHQPFTVSVFGNEQPVTFSIALHDDLTGREKHELSLKRPPRMTKSFTLDSGSHEFTVPYGGLIYVQGGGSKEVTITLSNTVDAPLYDVTNTENNGWINPINSPAPIGEVVSNSFVYTAPKLNLNAERYEGKLDVFANELDIFSEDLNDFYARNETASDSKNRKATDVSMPNNRHHFVNDVAISIGAAHSGYPVMNDSFNVQRRNLSTTPLNDWLLWHEVGHNAAEAPFTVAGATEVANNILALYMQDKHLGKMERVVNDIQLMPEFIESEKGHVWGAGGAGERLVMFAQLKEWAETEFDINDWYEGRVPAYYETSITGMKGWNLFKLMHRLTRNESELDLNLKGTNYCYNQNLEKSDALMLCASYAAQTDLTEFFSAWNPGVVAQILPGQEQPIYEGGVSPFGKTAVSNLKLPMPQRDPLKISEVTVRSLQ
ncbi:SslE/AcfD family lipoprotein zinc metalloprotease [Aliivibrio sp. S2TY2]|uniref:SslE/AcfD family lipoprotein zinc metalloprotease n=1 Tax=unclassified Aliivibrio TaxID=2645654 RepID=UPI002379A090|nr:MULTISPECIES: SslE/AcfD family lipoprotein zinc metalloprotease [unclassified Aliivibrio]MDD9176369.1 SslE/AcfD family lipoprotein zinc metalloprotease [Aliivibrio sp. S3TY1]MDD9193467.1 SslE/AcfD family lipoprotein zinc metalloprotease [Aliivibrio sp. S2TY2]